MNHSTVVRIERKELDHMRIICEQLQISMLILEEVVDTDVIRVRLEPAGDWQLFYVGHMLATRVATESLERIYNEKP